MAAASDRSSGAPDRGDRRAGAEQANLRFRVTDLRRSLAGREQHHRSVGLAGLRVGDAEVAEEPVEVDVLLETIAGGVRAEIAIAFDWIGDCRRCLGPAMGRETIELTELFADAPRDLASEEEDVLPISEGWIDLAGVVRDSVLLGLPLAPLCRTDCAGPSPEQFPVSIEDEGLDSPDGQSGDGPAKAPDPRWAALSELDFDPPQD